jgi:hypothetical protein
MRVKELALENGGQERLTKMVIDNDFLTAVKASEADKKAITDKETQRAAALAEKLAREALARTPEGVAKKRRLDA